MRSLVAAGAAAGIGASFNAPIAGMLFALEVILGSFAVRHMSAVVLASIAAAVTLRSLVGEDALLRADRYALGDSRELLLYAGLAIASVGAAVIFLRLVDGVERVMEGAFGVAPPTRARSRRRAHRGRRAPAPGDRAGARHRDALAA